MRAKPQVVSVDAPVLNQGLAEGVWAPHPHEPLE